MIRCYARVSSKGQEKYGNGLESQIAELKAAGGEKIYSDAYIKIEQSDQVTEGIGFSANQNLTLWQINNTKGIFAVEE